MRKILYLHNNYINSQEANILQVVSMCDAMSNVGFSVTLSVPSSSSEDYLSEYSKKYKFKVDFRKIAINNARIDKYLNWRAVEKVIQSETPDLLYIRNPILLKQSLKFRIPIYLELHHIRLHEGSNLLNKYWVSFVKKNVNNNKIRKVICISRSLKNYWVDNGLEGEKIIVAHDAVNPELFSQKLDTISARRLLNLPIDKPIITYSGRLYVDRKIENIIKLAGIFKDVLFLVIGGPENQREYYDQLAKLSDISNVNFIGQIEHSKVPTYLGASDILLALWSREVPTINYCSPMKLFEYMAAGKIIVAHGFETIREVLCDNDNALLVDPDSFEDLVKKTEFALKGGNLQSLGQKARLLVESKYTWFERCKTIFEDFES